MTLDLFDVGERNPLRLPKNGKTCTPYPVGSGPDGKKCGNCAFAHRFHQGKQWIKCHRATTGWTHSTNTDIKARWPACFGWRPAKAWPSTPEFDFIFGKRIADVLKFEVLLFADPEWCLPAADLVDEHPTMCSDIATTLRLLSQTDFHKAFVPLTDD